MIRRSVIIGYGLYDFANSAYILIFNTLIFPVFFREEVLKGHASADFAWGVILSSSILLALILGPVAGFVGDKRGRKRLLQVFIAGASAGAFALALAPVSPLVTYAGIFILTNACYIVSISLYDSLISHVSTDEDRPLISGFAWGLGYLGGVICLIIIFAAQGTLGATVRHGFLITAGFYALFSMLSLRMVPDDALRIPPETKVRDVAKLFANRKFALLLVSFWFITEAIAVIIYFTGLYGTQTLGLSLKTVGILLMFMHVLAFPGTWVMGVAAHRHGERPVINLTLFLWVVVIGLLLISTTIWHLVALAVVAAFVLGSSQAMMRSYYSRRFPDEVSGSSFGVYTLVSRVASLVGTPLFGFISASTGSQKIAMMTVLIPLAIGGILFNRVSRS